MVFIYVLKLENNKYYIGKALNYKKRLEDHYNININWIKKYKPINIIEVIPVVDDLDEDTYTIKYMKEKGINNVRGGTFVEIILDDVHINVIKKFIHESINKCYICGDNNHCTQDCKPIYKCYCIASYLSPHTINNCLLKPINNYLYDCEDDIIDKLKDKVKGTCYRCGRYGHYSTCCYDNEDINGYKIVDSDEESLYKCNNCKKIFNGEKNLFNHEQFYCKNNKNYVCKRCGRDDHTINNCIHTKDINGTLL